MPLSPKILTKKQQLAQLARARRRALAVYFHSGILPPAPSLPLFQTSSESPPSTLYVCQQKGKK